MAASTPETIADEDRIEIPEWGSSDPLQLTDEDLDLLESEVSDQLDVRHRRDGSSTIEANHHVGIVGLPDGPTIEIRPKAAGDNLPYLIRYASGKSLDPTAIPTPATPGRSFVDTFAALFLAQLTATVRSGLDKAYVERHEPQRFLRGQLNLVRQLQKQGPFATELECDFEQLTTDTLLNQAVLFAAHTLAGLSREPGLRSDLSLWTERLKGHVTLRPVSAQQLQQIELTRLNDHYAQLLQLTRWTLQGLFVEDLRAGAHRAFSLLVDMNDIFEDVVEQAARRGVGHRPGWSLTGQERTRDLLISLDGSRTPSLRPDLVLRHEGEVVAVADAKWKTDVRTGDIQQLVAYQRTYDAPGLLVYPAQEGSMHREYRVRKGFRLHLVEVPTDADADSPRQIGDRLEDALATEVDRLTGEAA